MKVLHFGKYYACHHAGGVESYVDTLLTGLAQQGLQLVNLVSNVEAQTSQLQANYGKVVEVASLGKLQATSLCPTMPYWAWKLNKAYSFDIVHLHFPDPMSHLASLVLPRKIKKVLTWHSDIVRQKTVLKYYQPFLKRFLRSVDAVIVSNAVLSSFPQLYQLIDDPKKIHAIPLAIDVERFSQADRERVLALQKKYEKPIIFALGRHVSYKGFSYLIAAMKDVSEAVLVLGGDGPLTAELKQQVLDLGLQNSVHFVGGILADDLVNYYHAAQVFCLPSIAPNEAYGIVQLEAMACGKPVVCCELNNGVTFVNQDNKTGLVVPPRDPQMLADALNNLLNDEGLRKKLGQYAKERIEKEFTQRIMVEKTLTIYKALQE